MKIVMVTVGSRGDVQPMVALCLAFQAAGHQAVLAGPPEKAAWAEGLGCAYVPLGHDFTALMDRFESVHRLAPGIALVGKIRSMVVEQFSTLPGVIKGADLVVGASLCFALFSIAEAMGTPYRFVGFTPQWVPSAHHPCPVFKHHGWPQWWNRLGWRFMLFFDRFHFTRLINHHRRAMGLAPLYNAWYHVLGPKLIVATDRQIAAVPDDIPVDAVQTGYMHLSQTRRRLSLLEDFLAAGPAPVYAGFGSMPRADQVWLHAQVIAAVRKTGRRLVLARFWDETSRVDPNGDLFYISHFPHEQLFPHMAAVIHHGGAGTTAFAARSGVPQILVPYVLDQFYWGHQIHRSGLGPRPIPRARLTAKRLAAAIEAATNSPMLSEKAKAVQVQLQETDGANAAVMAILDSLEKATSV
jgi:UDP:flavonoid glycosyltransferase YjiC (YdhE family)